MSKVAPAGAETSRVFVLIIVITLGLLAYTLYQNNSLEGQVHTLQLENDNLELNLQALGVRVSYLISLLTTTTGAPAYSFEVTSACMSTGQNCPLGPGAGSGMYVYSFGIRNTGTGSIPATAPVFMEFKDTTVPSTFQFNATLSSSVAPNSTAYLQSASWPLGTNASSKLSPGDSVSVIIYIGNVQGGIDTAVLTCASSTATEVNGTSTTQTLTCG